MFASDVAFVSLHCLVPRASAFSGYIGVCVWLVVI